MTPVLSKYLAKEREMKRLQEEMDCLKKDERFQKDQEFLDKMYALIEEYDKKYRDVAAMLAPELMEDKAAKGAGKRYRRARSMKRFTNPHTQEVVEAKSTNHSVLKDWKEHYGTDEVNSWAEDIG